MDLTELREYLTKFKYPNIQEMNDEEVTKICNPPNRIYFLCWLIELIEPSLSLDPTSQETASTVANFIGEHGFCLKWQEDVFVSGDLPVLDQLFILKRIFTFIDSSTKPDIEPTSISLDEIESYFNSVINMNLFSDTGPPKRLSLAKRQQKIEEHQKSLVEINQKIAEIQRNPLNEQKQHIDIDDELDDLQNQLESSLAQFQMHSFLLTEEKCNFPTSNLTLNCNKDVLKETSENIDAVIQILRDTKTISEFPERNRNLVLGKESEDVNEIFEIITDTATLSNEVELENNYCI